MLCIGCGAQVPDIAGMVHTYLDTSPGCWVTYGDVMARQYRDPVYRQAYRVTVDAYAVQHPGSPSTQTINAIAAHLIRLYLMLERGFPPVQASMVPTWAMESRVRYFWLEPPTSRGDITVMDVYAARNSDEHTKAVWKWGGSAWDAWEVHHDIVRRWAALILG